MKKLNFLLAIMVLLGFTNVKAQQLPMFTQYMFNDYIINPAIAGTHDYDQVKTNYRYQWIGIKDGPKTYLLSYYGPHKTQPMGWGGYIFSDKTGPTKRTGVYGSYAYNIEVTGDIRVSAGIFVGMVQYDFDLSAMEFDDESDPVLLHGNNYRKTIPDASFGVYVYSSQFTGGVSMNQLLSNKIQMTDTIVNKDAIGKLKNHIYLHGSYNYNINREFDLKPTLLLKTMLGVPPQLDISVRTVYQKMAWLGFAWRTSDAVSVLLGYNYNNMINIGLSYDLTVSQLSKYSDGTLEIMIGVKFNMIKQSGKSGGKRKLR